MPCFRHFKSSEDHPGVYTIDASRTTQPQHSSPSHLLPTATTVNCNKLVVISESEAGPCGKVTISALEATHVWSSHPRGFNFFPIQSLNCPCFHFSDIVPKLPMRHANVLSVVSLLEKFDVVAKQSAC